MRCSRHCWQAASIGQTKPECGEVFQCCRTYGTKWQWEQVTLAREIFYLRRVLGHPKFNQVPATVKCIILNNLGTRLRVAGRISIGPRQLRRLAMVLWC